MILSSQEIDAAIRTNQIVIEPRPDEAAWTSTAIDLTLNDVLLEWSLPKSPPTGGEIQWPRPKAKNFNVQAMMDDPNLAKKVPINPTTGYELKPRSFVLGFTREIVQLPIQSRIAARVEGKSSLARVGLGVHVTAPTIHAGFGVDPNKPDQRGTVIQLEIFNLAEWSVILDVGMRICQLILEEVREVPVRSYGGQFNAQKPFLAVPQEKSSR
jgi:dCTP deaminase